MDAFKTITDRHLELLSQQQSPGEGFLDTIRQFREQIFQSGKEVFAPAERDQLRSILRYWTNYINQNSTDKIYDTRDLDEFQGVPQQKRPARWLWIIGGVLLVVLIVAVGGLFANFILLARATQAIVITQVQSTLESSQIPPTWTAVAALEPTGTSTPTQSVKVPPTVVVIDVKPGESITIHGENFQPNQTFEAKMVMKDKTGSIELAVGSFNTGEGGSITKEIPIPKEFAGVDQLSLILTSETSGVTTAVSFSTYSFSESPVLSVSFINPENYQDIPPVLTFQGTYANLRPGWMIFLTFKPDSKADLIYPWKEYYSVGENTSEGSWNIPVNLEAQFDLSKPDGYLVDVVVANTESIRDQLLSGVESGFTSLPSEAIPMNKPLRLTRQAYKVIDEERILYSAWLFDQKSQELFSARLDGSDITQITFTPDSYEDNPSLSGDGTKIAFVDAKDYSLWIMDSNGENRSLVYKDPNPKRTLEGPVFSPDGRYLAFSASETNVDTHGFAQAAMNIYVIDLNAGQIGTVEPIALTENQDQSGNYISNRWPSWLDDQSLIYSGLRKDDEYVYKVNLVSRTPELFYGRLVTGNTVYKPPPIQMAAFSHAVNMLAFTSPFPTDVPEVYVVIYPNGKPLQLTNDQVRDQYPQWSLDGQMIFYESNPKSNHEIWAINKDGTHNHKVIGDNTFSIIWPYVGKMVANFLIKP